jgi:hypothetical protein
MKMLRVVDQSGNRYDYETDFVPRIGEHLLLADRQGRDSSALLVRGGENAALRHFRVADVLYRLDRATEDQAAILVQEETNPQPWPG